MSCTLIDPFVTPYVDGEISDADRRAVDEHLRRCPPCYSRVAAERVVHELVHARGSALETTPAPESLRAACSRIAASVTGDQSPVTSDQAPVTSLQSPVTHRLATGGWRPFERLRVALSGVDGRPQTAFWRARLTPYALAASLVVVVGGVFVYQATERSDRVMAAELTADHVRCFAMNAVLGTHEDAPAVESSIAASFGWRTHVPEDHAGGQLELVGVRPCLYGNGKVAHIMYRHEGRPVSLFMLPNTARARDLIEVLGHEAAIWCVGTRTFVLVAREPKPDVERLASFVQAGLH